MRVTHEDQAAPFGSGPLGKCRVVEDRNVGRPGAFSIFMSHRGGAVSMNRGTSQVLR